MDLLGHQWDLGRTLKGHRAQSVLLLVRPTPNVTHTSWFLGGSKSIKKLFFVSLRMEHGHGRVKGETRSSVFLLELGLLGSPTGISPLLSSILACFSLLLPI